MKRATSALFLAFSMLSMGYASADSDQSPRKEVTALVQKLYSYKSATFEGKKIDGKHNATAHCKLLHEMFVDEMLLQDPDREGSCKPKVSDSDVPFRFPGLLYEDLGEGGNLHPDYPVPIVEYVKVYGASGTIAVTFSRSDAKRVRVDSFGRSVLFASKVDGVWKFSNALLYPHNWERKKLQHCSDVKYKFVLRPANEKQLEDLPKDCLAQEIANIKDSSYKY